MPDLPFKSTFRGTELHTKGWLQEAALRCLQNNLDPEVAEDPANLIVYGGRGKAARNHEALPAIVRSLTELENDETLLVQSGKPVGILQTHPLAPRVLIANSLLVPEWATWENFWELEAAGLIMYGQMTAGSWIYIGTQGILQGTYQTFVAIAEQTFGGSLAGTITLTGGVGGMGGAQPLAVTLNGGVVIAVDIDPGRIERRLEIGYLDVARHRLDDAFRQAEEARSCPQTAFDWPRRQRRRCLRRGRIAGRCPVDIVTDQTSAHDPLHGYIPNGFTLGVRCGATRGRSGSLHPQRVVGRWPSTARRWSICNEGVPRFSTMATTCEARQYSAASPTPSPTRALFLPISVLCSARAWVRFAGSPSRATQRISLRPIGPWRRSFPTTIPSSDGWRWQPRRFRSRACRLGSAGSGYGERHQAGLAFNDLVASGKVSAPIVIGRDHLDSGSVASPYRETEAMADGSDAIADWPILNALVNTASGAAWVAVHHGGGVGIGKSIHAGAQVVADGTAEGAFRVERVLTNDPAMGVLRHADAGYEKRPPCS